MRAQRTIVERFWAKVDTNGPTAERPPGLGSCWLWTAYRNSWGYGKIRDGGRSEHAHRLAWTLAGPPIPDGFLVLHACDNPGCVRNDEPGIYVIRGIARPRFGHLWLGTNDDNQADKAIKGRSYHPPTWVAPTLRGEDHPRARLTAEIVLKCRRLVASGASTSAALARQYGVSHCAMWEAVSGKHWKHLE